MLRRVLLILISLNYAFAVLSQKEDNNWYFGYNAGITFNTNPPTAVHNGQLYAHDGCASISAANGRLLFYTDGISVWDSTHNTMPNGYGLQGGGFSSQSAIIVPRPGSANLYYIFTVNNYLGSSGLRYSEVDMRLNSGKGDIISNKKNILLKTPVCEKLIATLHKNGHDFWVLAIQFNSDSVLAYKVTNSGIVASPTVSVTPLANTSKNNSPEGCMKISPDGRKVAFTSTLLHKIALGDFDPSTGKVSNVLDLYHPSFFHEYFGIEFSPQGKFLYVSGLGEKCIVRLNISLKTKAEIVASKILVGSYFPGDMGALQLGPDGKIYITIQNSPYLSVIHAPDSLKWKLEKNYILLSPGKSWYGLPSLVQLHREELNIGNDTAICLGDSLKLAYNIKNIRHVEWNTGDTAWSIMVSKEGRYSVIIEMLNNTFRYDTIDVKIRPKFTVYIGNDTTFCGKFSHLLKTNKPFKNYYWSTGATNMQITANNKGMYFVKVLDSNNCANGDTIAIDQVFKPVVKQNYDSVTCKYVYLSVDSLSGLTYKWGTGETQKQIKVINKGWYSITASHQFCSIKDSVLVKSLPVPDVNLGPDTSLCPHEILLMANEQGHYLWSTMASKAFIAVNTPGEYWLKVSRNNCSASDTINITLCGDMQYFIPNTFSPNDDNINEVFRVYGSNISQIEMEIYNRWGEKLLETKGKDPCWNGTFKDEICMEGIYMYKLTLKGKKAGSIKYLKGNVILLR